MKLITTKTHGVIDYLAGILLILMPWPWDYNPIGLEGLTPLLLGFPQLSSAL